MIQELQSYIESLESLAQQQKEEIHRVSEQNKIYARQTRNPQSRPKLGEEFAGDGTDLPPKLRAIIEDNRVLKDRAKKYKDEVSKTKQTVTSQEQQILKLQDKLKSVSEKLTALSQSHGDAETQEKLREKVEKQERTITDLEHKIAVITKSKETENKKFRNSLAQANKKVKEKDVAIVDLQSRIEDKDKEVRAKVLEFKAFQRKIAEQRSRPSTQATKKKEEAAKDAAAATAKGAAAAASEAKGPAKGGPVKFVINVVEDRGSSGPGSKGGKKKAASKDMSAEEAAVGIQSKFRGYKARKTVAKQKEDRERAATKIQAIHRGRQGRKAAATKKGGGSPAAKASDEPAPAIEVDEDLEKAAVKIQSRARGYLAKKKVDKLKEDKAEGGEEDGEEEVETKITRASGNLTEHGCRARVLSCL